jgi:hypothetical protein
MVAGGWGPALSTAPSINIPSKDILFLNNVLLNPSNESAQWSHFSVRWWYVDCCVQHAE